MRRFHQFNLQLLQLSDVGVTLQLQVSHLVFMFLMLMQPLVLLSLLLLSCKLENRGDMLLLSFGALHSAPTPQRMTSPV